MTEPLQSWTWQHRRSLAVVPETPTSTPSVPPATTRSRPARWCTTQGHGRGAYSIERLCAYHAYQSRASSLRLLLACVLTPLPPLVAILAVESIPLQSPSLGWRVNYMAFARAFVCALAPAAALALQTKNILPELEMTTREATVITLSTGVMYTALVLLLGIRWAFPVPFMIPVCCGPFGAFLVLATIVTVGLRRFYAVPNIRQRITSLIFLTLIQASLLVIYPTFQAMFVRQRTAAAQIAGVCALQLIKLVVKRLLDLLISGGIGDYKPEMVVFSAEVYHGLYVSACMQSATSPWTKFVIIALDISQQVVALYRLGKRVQCTHGDGSPRHGGKDIVSFVVQLLETPEKLKRARLSNLHINSILDSQLSDHGKQTLEKFRQTLVSANPENVAPRTTKAKPSSILPVPLRQSLPPSSTFDSNLPPTVADSLIDTTRLLNQTLGILFTTEYLALAEYVECMIPLVYAMYLAVMRRLSNAQFYPLIAALSKEDHADAISSILVYAALEFASFAIFHAVLQRRIGVSPLRQLAFVLENQMEMVEGKLFAWVFLVLQFPLVHFGADFSFEFAWL